MRYSRGDVASATERIVSSDPELGAEIAKVAKAKQDAPWVAGADKGLRRLANVPEPQDATAMDGLVVPDFELETIVQRVGRPVLVITEGNVVLNIEEAESAVWKNRLEQAAAVLQPSIAAVGRVEATNWLLGLPYVGTGWLVDDDLIV